ncbi:MAG: hypothetical protein ACRD2F_03590 [Terriglobales bacterium]
MITPAPETCATCRHYRPSPPDAAALMKNFGRCQALPPHPLLLPTPTGLVLQSIFPVVTPEVTCGLFMPQPEFPPHP